MNVYNCIEKTAINTQLPTYKVIDVLKNYKKFENMISSLSIDITPLLDENGWLTSDIINTFFELIETKDISYLNSFWLYSSRPHKNKNLNKQTGLVLVPVNRNSKYQQSADRNHWSLIAIDFKNKSILYFDSYPNSNGSFFLDKVYNIINDYNQEIDLTWELIDASSKTPKQTDVNSCGVFVLAITIEIIANINNLENIKFKTNQSMIRQLRLRFADKILQYIKKA